MVMPGFVHASYKMLFAKKVLFSVCLEQRMTRLRVLHA
jgi:hypothetical protein